MLFAFISSRQPSENRLAHQSRWNVLQVQGVKRGGYRVPGSDQVVLSFGFVISSFRSRIPTKSLPWPMDGLLEHGLPKVYSASLLSLCRKLCFVHVWRVRLVNGNLHASRPLMHHVWEKWFVFDVMSFTSDQMSNLKRRRHGWLSCTKSSVKISLSLRTGRTRPRAMIRSMAPSSRYRFFIKNPV